MSSKAGVNKLLSLRIIFHFPVTPLLSIDWDRLSTIAFDPKTQKSESTVHDALVIPWKISSATSWESVSNGAPINRTLCFWHHVLALNKISCLGIHDSFINFVIRILFDGSGNPSAGHCNYLNSRYSDARRDVRSAYSIIVTPALSNVLFNVSSSFSTWWLRSTGGIAWKSHANSSLLNILWRSTERSTPHTVPLSSDKLFWSFLPSRRSFGRSLTPIIADFLKCLFNVSPIEASKPMTAVYREQIQSKNPILKSFVF